MTLLRALLFALAASPAAAVDPDDLLPVEEAFQVSARALDRDTLELHFEIAEGYYLYRERMQSRDGSGISVQHLALPAGTPSVDEFFGPVQTYRQRLRALLAVETAPGATEGEIRVRFQGCADVGICYPPHWTTVSLSLPETSAPPPPVAAAPIQLAANTPVLDLFGGASGGLEEPLPAEEAFRLEAIAVADDQILARFIMPPHYYLYRDRSTFEVVSGEPGLLSEDWPAGEIFSDEFFGDMEVYFDLVEIRLQLSADATAPIRLRAQFQGCLKDEICYPPMSRELVVTLP